MIIVSALLGLLRIDTIQVGSFYDDSHYIVLAESLANGSGYRLINYPVSPPENAFPPGWSLILSPFVAFFPENYALLKVVSFAFWLLSILLILRLFRQRINHGWLTFLIVYVVIHPAMVGISGTVMSESAYLFFSLSALVVIECWQREPTRWQWTVVGFVVACCATAIRTVGITLIAAIVVGWLLQQRWDRKLILRVIFAALLLTGVIAILLASGIRMISDEYQEYLKFILSQLTEYLQFWKQLEAVSFPSLADAVIPVFDLSITTTLLTETGVYILSVVLLLVVAVGLLYELRKRQIVELYVLFYVILLYFWVVFIKEVQPRLLIPIIPFLCYYFFSVLIGVSNWLTTRFASASGFVKRMTPLVAASLLLLLLARNVQDWRKPQRERSVDLSLSGNWLRTNSVENSVIMAIDAVPTYLYARRHTVNYPTEGENIAEYLAENQVDYVLIQPSLKDVDRTKNLSELNEYTVTKLQPYLNAHPEDFEGVFAIPTQNIVVYEVIR